MRIEVNEKRTECSKAFYIGGSQYTLEAHGGPIHYKDNYADLTEPWKDSDYTIVNGKITKAPYELTIDEAKLSVTFKDKKTGEIITLSLESIGGKQVVKGKLSDQKDKTKVKWNSFDKDIDLEIEALRQSVSFKRIILDPSAPTDATFKITGTASKLKTKAKDANGKAIRVIHSIDQDVLSESLHLEDLVTAVYPIEIDPNYGDNGSDGYCYSWGKSTYAQARAGADTADSTETSVAAGQGYIGGTGFYIMRAYAFFNTSALPDDCTITAASVNLYGSADVSTEDFNLRVYASTTGGAPHEPLIVGDFLLTLYGGPTYGGSLTSNGWNLSGYNTITLDATGLSWISKTATTVFCLYSDKDVAATEPTTREQINWYTSEDTNGGRDPYLAVSYLVPVSLSGALTFSGTLGRKTSKSLAGSLTSSGALNRKTFKTLAGSLTSSGALTGALIFFKSLAGALTFSGTLGIKVSKSLSGVLTSSGTLGRKIYKSLSGALTSSGVLGIKIKIALSGTLNMSGVLTKIIKFTKSLAGALTFVGTLGGRPSRNLMIRVITRQYRKIRVLIRQYRKIRPFTFGG